MRDYKFPTLHDVRQELLQLEEEFGTTTAEFLQSVQEHGDIPEDNVAEWIYLVEQLKVLEKRNSSTERGYLDSVVEEDQGHSCTSTRELSIAA